MPTHRVTFPDGRTAEVSGDIDPSPLMQQSIEQFVQKSSPGDYHWSQEGGPNFLVKVRPAPLTGYGPAQMGDATGGWGRITTMPGSKQIGDLIQGSGASGNVPMAQARGFLAGGTEGLLNAVGSPLSLMTGVLAGPAAQSAKNMASDVAGAVSGPGLKAAAAQGIKEIPGASKLQRILQAYQKAAGAAPEGAGAGVKPGGGPAAPPSAPQGSVAPPSGSGATVGKAAKFAEADTGAQQYQELADRLQGLRQPPGPNGGNAPPAASAAAKPKIPAENFNPARQDFFGAAKYDRMVGNKPGTTASTGSAAQGRFPTEMAIKLEKLNPDQRKAWIDGLKNPQQKAMAGLLSNMMDNGWSPTKEFTSKWAK